MHTGRNCDKKSIKGVDLEVFNDLPLNELTEVMSLRKTGKLQIAKRRHKRKVCRGIYNRIWCII